MYKSYQEMNGSCTGKLFYEPHELGDIAAVDDRFYAEGRADVVSSKMETPAAIGYVAYWGSQEE